MQQRQFVSFSYGSDDQIIQSHPVTGFGSQEPLNFEGPLQLIVASLNVFIYGISVGPNLLVLIGTLRREKGFQVQRYTCRNYKSCY